MPRKLKLGLVTLAVSLVFTIGMAELLLRAAGFRAWEPYEYGWRGTHEPDPVLGWRTRPGQYTVPGRADKPLTVTFGPTGRRAEEPEPRGGRPRIVLIGDSFTEGQWLSDHETYAWKLQARYPSIDVQNYGVAGYGTYQSLLLLEKILAEPDPPKLVLYGFIDTHINRNVAPADWLRRLAQASEKDHPRVPYVTFDREHETLVRHPPRGYPKWPLCEYSALVNFAQQAYMSLVSRKRHWFQEEIFEKLVLEMNQLSRKHGAEFTIVLFELADRGLGRARLIPFFEENGINYIDCDFPLVEGFIIPGDGHPNDRMTTLYAECIDKGIDQKISGLSARTQEDSFSKAGSGG